jgi:hypothetical protein
MVSERICQATLSLLYGFKPEVHFGVAKTHLLKALKHFHEQLIMAHQSLLYLDYAFQRFSLICLYDVLGFKQGCNLVSCA